MAVLAQGAEAKVYIDRFLGRDVIVKERFPKRYRHPELDAKLTKQRILGEVRAIARCKDVGVATPSIFFVDLSGGKIFMEYLDGAVTVKEHLYTHGVATATHTVILRQIGETLSRLHTSNIIHGDLTTSNMMLRAETATLVMIDFGLSAVSTSAEDKAVDLYVLERAFASTHPQSEPLFEEIIRVYSESDPSGKADLVLKKLEDVRSRGRKRTMLG
eukprot:m.145268 g.145268  ORF g.145268 m.145268 type:complete len:216 (+) comp23065_c0_seq3:435-1082(+)